jgi:oligosaccharyltransferase complex subunit gamma
MARIAVFLTLLCIVFTFFSVEVAGKPNPKLDRILKMTRSGKGAAKLDSQSFVKSLESPRDYAMVVLLTALGDKFKCTPCKYVHPLIFTLNSHYCGHVVVAY